MAKVTIVSPTLDEYMERVRSISVEALGDASSWFKLEAGMIYDADDRDEFSFIKMALWDKLMELEFFPPGICRASESTECEIVEPGSNPGFTISGGVLWARTGMQALLNDF